MSAGDGTLGHRLLRFISITASSLSMLVLLLDLINVRTWLSTGCHLAREMFSQRECRRA